MSAREGSELLEVPTETVGGATVAQTSLFDSAVVRFVKPDECIDELARIVSAHKRSDPFRPVFVVTPDGAGKSISLALARRHGFASVEFGPIEVVARKVLRASPSRVGDRSLSSELEREMCRLVASGARGPLAGQDPQVLAGSLTAVFKDLRHRSDLEVQRIAEMGPIPAELVRMFGEFRELAAPFSDTRSRIESASTCLASGDELRDLRVVVLAYEPPQHYEAELMHRLAEHGALDVVAVVAGEVELDLGLQTSLWGLGVAAPPSGHVKCKVDKVLVAPDMSIEVQAAVAEILDRAAKGVPFNRMAILFGSGSEYRKSVEQALRRANIGVRGKTSERLSQTVAGRFVERLAALACDFSPDAVFDFCAAGPIVDRSGSRVEWQRWRAIARSARLFVESASWVDRLAHFVSTRRDDDPVRSDAGEFLDFVQGLDSFVKGERATWAEWSEWTLSAFARFFGGDTTYELWPANESNAVVSVERALRSLAELDLLATAPSAEAFEAAIVDLARKHCRSISDPAGVFVGDFREAVGHEFAFAMICGLAEGLTGSGSPEGLRAALVVPGEEFRSERDRRSFRLAMASTKSLVVSVPRSDRRSQRPRRPSPWLVEIASQLAHGPVAASEIVDGGSAEWPWLERIESFTHLLSRSILPAQSLIDVAFGGSSTNEAIGIVSARESNGWTAYEGLVGKTDELGEHLQQDLYPTRIEQWSTCPFRYYMASVLGVGEQEPDPDPASTSPLDYGNLVHKALQEFLTRVERRSSPWQPWSDDERELLWQIAQRLHEVSRRQGRTPAGLLYALESRSLKLHLEAVLDRDEAFRRAHGVMPAIGGVETEVPALRITSSSGREVTFKARLDRLDRSPSGDRLVATDYKTGRANSCPDLNKDATSCGTKLQAGVYLEALARAHPDASISAGYWFVADAKSGYKRVDIHSTEEVRERVVSSLTTIVDGIESGVFVPNPGSENDKTFTNCRKCPFDDVCPSDRGELWARKSESTDAVGVFVSLSEKPSK